jgi:hypothetical protein
MSLFTQQQPPHQLTDDELSYLGAIARNVFGGLLYGISAFYLFGGVWRSLMLFALTYACLQLGYGARKVSQGSLVVAAVTMLVIFGLVDHPTRWLSDLRSLSAGTN